MHCEQIIAAAKAGKHVFVEKPLGVDAKSAEQAVAACAQPEVTLAVGYNWRFQPTLQEARHMLDDVQLCKLPHIQGHVSRPSPYCFARQPLCHHRHQTTDIRMN